MTVQIKAESKSKNYRIVFDGMNWGIEGFAAKFNMWVSLEDDCHGEANAKAMFKIYKNM